MRTFNLKCFYKIFLRKAIFFIIILFAFSDKKEVIYVENDNVMTEYQKNIDFSNLKTNIKAIALYLPQFHEIDENNKFWGKGFTEWVNVRKCYQRFKDHHQPRIPGDKFGYLNYYDLSSLKAIESQIKLAKSHGIYGFGIYYYWFSGKQLLEKPLNIFIKYSNIEFHFLLIWANENWTKKWDGREQEILIKQQYKRNDPSNFIKHIKKYIIDKRYIKFDNKPIIGLYEPKKIPNLRKTIEIWRKKSKEFGIGDIFILICINNNKIQEFENLNLFNASYEFPPRNSFDNHRIEINNTYIYFYNDLLYFSYYFNDSNIDLTKLYFFRGTMLEWDNCPRISKCSMFYNYSPEKFYIYNKIIVEWTTKHYYKDYRFIFINAWNEWGEGSYLEPDDKYGYASINSLSKAIFNLSYSINFPILEDIRIAIIVNIENFNLIELLIDKLNNIPYIYDLFLYSNNKINRNLLKDYIKIKSNQSHFEFNERENLLSFLFHFRKKSKNYKYFCILNNFKYKTYNFYLNETINFVLNNLLGNQQIITEIINDFENNNQLGIVFPDKYFKHWNLFMENTSITDRDYINSILTKIYPKVYISIKFNDFPDGNMFWAKVNAIYPIFNLYPKLKLKGKNRLIYEFNLSKILIFILKIEGFFYKKIFKYI